jgi:hypothetical protein
MISFNEYMIINELQNKMMQHMQSLVPNWPPYVISDLLLAGKKIGSWSDLNTLSTWLQELADSYGYSNPQQMQWKLETIMVTKDIFDEETLRRMQERGMGKFNPYEVPNDTQRHQGASTRIQQNPSIKVHGYSGPSSNEPIILVRWKNGKHELFEGWHRTMQMLLAKPEGYQQKAYVLQSNK